MVAILPPQTFFFDILYGGSANTRSMLSLGIFFNSFKASPIIILCLVFIFYSYFLSTQLKPETKFPPTLQVYDKKDIAQFEELNKYGEYSVEFIFVVTELIMIQEKTNYPTGTMNIKVFERFRDKNVISFLS